MDCPICKTDEFNEKLNVIGSVSVKHTPEQHYKSSTTTCTTTSVHLIVCNNCGIVFKDLNDLPVPFED